MNNTKKSTTIKAYASRAELIEHLTNWHAKCGVAIRQAECVEMFKEIGARLKKTNGKKVPMAGLVQQYNLNDTELFLLLFLAISQVLRVITPSTCKVTALLSSAQTFASSKEVLETLFDGKSVLFSKKILVFSGGLLDIRKNPLLDYPSIKSTRTPCRTFSAKRVLTELNKYVIGQGHAKKQLVAGVFEHLAKCAQKSDVPFTKNNIFISGPTGCGKTYLCQSLARILKIPFVHADASQYTQAGYTGMSVGNMLQPLQLLANDKKLPLSIVFIDEIDKLREGSERWGISSGNVQAELLRMVESQYFTTEDPITHKNTDWDISRVLFVAGGAFENLQVKHADKSVGFMQAAAIGQEPLSADDYIGYGMLPEFIGRFSYFVQLNPLEKEDLRRILLNPYNGPISQYKKLLHLPTAVIESEIVEEMVNRAYERRLGARGLQQQVGQLFQEQFLQQTVKVCL